MVEQGFHKAKVAGSIPAISTNKMENIHEQFRGGESDDALLAFQEEIKAFSMKEQSGEEKTAHF